MSLLWGLMTEGVLGLFALVGEKWYWAASLGVTVVLVVVAALVLIL